MTSENTKEKILMGIRRELLNLYWRLAIRIFHAAMILGSLFYSIYLYTNGDTVKAIYFLAWAILWSIP